MTQEVASFKWPENLADFELTKKEVGIIEHNIRKTQKLLLDGPFNFFADAQGYGYVVLDKHDIENPRRLIVSNQGWTIVVLNNTRMVPGHKIGYIPERGQICVKKRAEVIAQQMLVTLVKNFEQNDSLHVRERFVEVVHIEHRHGHFNYFELFYPNTLSKLCSEHRSLMVSFIAISKLIDALRTINSLTYQPPQLTFGQSMVRFEEPFHGFYGEIHPDNIVVEMNEEGDVKIKLLGCCYSSFSTLRNREGWMSPEIVRRMNGKEVRFDWERYIKQDGYGAKNDAWQLGLLLGSMLLGKFVVQRGSFNLILPSFNFILQKLATLSNGTIDQSEIAKLTQEEIDDEINGIMKTIVDSKFLSIWKIIRNDLLRVDPYERKNIADLLC